MAVVAACSIVVAAACGGGGSDGPEKSLDLVTTTTSPEELLKLPDVSGVLLTLVDFLGFEPRFTGVQFDQLEVRVTIQTALDPEKLDSYLSRFDPETGDLVWTGPTPVSLNVDEVSRIPAQLFNREDVQWDTVPRLADDAVVGLVDIEPVNVIRANVGRNYVQDEADGITFYQGGDVIIAVDVEGIRGTGLLRSSATGEVLELRRR